MDFVKIVRSVEEALYEVMSWLIFYPLTLWRVLRHPLKTMRYSDAEQRDKPEEQYLETLSPPLFLVQSLLLNHGMGMLTPAEPAMETQVGRLIEGSVQNMMVFQSLLFSLHPLLFAAALVVFDGKKLDRDSLKAPFFAQCYLAGATAILVGLSALFMETTGWLAATGVALLLGATVWYLNVQRQWLMKARNMTQIKALGLSVGIFGLCGLIMLVVLIVVSGVDLTELEG